MSDTLKTASQLACNNKSYKYFSLKKLSAHYAIERLPFSLKILLENLLRNENGVDVTAEDIKALCA